MANCPMCMSPLKPGAKVCPACGTKVKTEIKSINCPTCGNPLGANAAFCNICGQPIERKENKQKEEKKEPKVMEATSAADLSVLDKQQQMENPKPSTDGGSSGEMDEIIVPDEITDEMLGIVSSTPKKQKEENPTNSMSDVELPGQAKPKPKPKPQIPIPTAPTLAQAQTATSSGQPARPVQPTMGQPPQSAVPPQQYYQPQNPNPYAAAQAQGYNNQPNGAGMNNYDQNPYQNNGYNGQNVQNGFNNFNDPTGYGQPQQMPNFAMTGKRNVKDFIPMFIIAAVMVIAAICVIAFNKTDKDDACEAPLNNLVKFFEEGDGAALKGSYLTDGDDDKDVDEKQLTKLGKMMKGLLEAEYGDDFKMTYDITYKGELTSQEIDALVTSSSKRSKVTKGYDLGVDMKIKGSEKEESNFTHITVLKYDGEWVMFLDPSKNASSLFGGNSSSSGNTKAKTSVE